jgi:hypothetical protein
MAVRLRLMTVISYTYLKKKKEKGKRNGEKGDGRRLGNSLNRQINNS